MTTVASPRAIALAAQARGLSLAEAAQHVRTTDPELAASVERLASEDRASRADASGPEHAIEAPVERG